MFNKNIFIKMDFSLNCDVLIEIVKKINNFEQIVRLVNSVNKSIFKLCLTDRSVNDYLVTFLPDSFQKLIKLTENEEDNFKKIVHMYQLSQIKIVCGSKHTISIDLKRTMWACGDNGDGQLGLGDTNNRLFLTSVPFSHSIAFAACGSYHTMILDTNGKLWGCGDNYFGQLGLDDTNTRLTLTQVPLPDPMASIPSVVSVICGGKHTIILDSDGKLRQSRQSRVDEVSLRSEEVGLRAGLSGLWGCGYNLFGQLGLNDTNNRLTLTSIPLPDSMASIASVGCGEFHTMVLDINGKVWGCGDNRFGQLGLGDTNDRLTLTQVPFINPIISVVCRGNHTIVLDTDGNLWGCGNNKYGQLGLGDINRRLFLTQVPLPVSMTPIPSVASVACGYNYTIVLDTDGKLWGCGRNIFSQFLAR